jgi:DNA ligase-associated metallophosphoesterase
MPATPLLFRGETILLDPAGILVWPRLALLAVADLHLEKGSASARRGQLVPPWDTALTLARLTTLIATYAPRIVVALGDSFHDDQAAARLSPANLTHLTHLTTQARFIWVRGNHDPSPPAGIQGLSTQAYEAENLTFRHQAHPTATGEISGHFHPKARIATRAADIARPCFIADDTRIILPSFGAYTGGLSVADPAIARHFPNGGRAFLLGQNRIFCFSVPAIPTDAPLPPCPTPLVTTQTAAKFPL